MDFISVHKHKLLTFVKSHPFEFLSIILLVLIASILRFWRIADYMTFLGDEGRDALVLLNMFKDGKFTLLGPSASVGGFFLGPAYYYVVIPGFLLFGMSPVGMSFEVAVLGVLSVLLIYILTRRYLGHFPALAASLIYAVSPTIVTFSRSSWNPNILPFLALCIFTCLIIAKEKKQKIFFFLTGCFFGLAIQSHYLGLILALPIFILVSIFAFQSLKNVIYSYILTVCGFFVTFSPYILFELRHGFTNTKTIFEFITKPSGAVGVREFQYSNNVFSAINRLFNETLSLSESNLPLAVGIVIILLSLFSFIILPNKSARFFFLTIFVWTFTTILGISAYNGELHNYYFALMFPIPALLIGFVTYIFSRNLASKIVIMALVATFALYLLSQNRIFSPPSNQLQTTESVADKVIELSGGQPFNFALMASGNTDYAYRFFLERKNHKPTPIEQIVTDQLIVVCEDKDCRYNLSPLPQILSFGPRELDVELDFIPGHIKIFRLVHP